ncbi:uncharacterized protein F4807DRAFT_462583 [Annulohypoxylon truncatum]|uniref:uncharacterized protein n=1 Tax=Annulohypoxylon truncatum TaxID=327061 RepID=UPI002008515F|nr:uncharacterized protein F4807DRAFT_462583 [Annulohypoxylon truncatum]KAI1207428.1 hypothetical protein F4807DRAFT_462583 [Annulohypoxylon truncatum]
MAPNKAKANGEDTRLSQREIEIVAVAWCSVKSIKDGKAILDMNQLVDKGLYKSVDSARHCWRPIENKLLKIAAAVKSHPGNNESGAPAGNSITAAAPAPRTPVKAMKGASGKRKLKVFSDAEDDDEEYKDAAAAAAAAKEGGVGEGGGLGGGVRKSRRTALPKPKMAPKKTTGAIAHAAAAKTKGAGAGKKRLVPTKLEETEGGYDEFESFSEVGDGEA